MRELCRELAKIIVERAAHDIVAAGTLLDRRDAEPLQFFLRDGNHDATQLVGVVRLPRFEGKGGSFGGAGRSSRGTSAGRGGAVTGATTDGAASPLRASRLAVMAANFAELTGGSPEMMRQ